MSNHAILGGTIGHWGELLSQCSDVPLLSCIGICVTLLILQMHGAGLAHTMFMPRGGDVIEMVSETSLDVRHFPLVGIFPRLSLVAGLNHFTLLVQAPEKSGSNVLIDAGYLSKHVTSFYRRKMKL